jgi:hypothetical protein
MRPAQGSGDQAEGLRRLFGGAGPCLLPVLLLGRPSEALADWTAQLARGFAQAGRRTLLIDGVQGHLAARLGLRTRHDLQQVRAGDCPTRMALARDAAGLAVVSATRACAAVAAEGGGLAQLLRPVLDEELQATDLLMVVLSDGQAGLLAPHEGLVGAPQVLVPLSLPSPADGAAAPAAHGRRRRPEPAPDAIELAVARLALVAAQADIGVFRLLFPGMAQAAVVTLVARMTASVRRAGVPCEIPTTPALAAARDPERVVAAVGGWALPSLRGSAPPRRRQPATVEISS